MNELTTEEQTPPRRDHPDVGADRPGESTLLGLVAVLLRERRTIFLIVGIGLVLSLAGAFLRAPVYTTTFSFIPQSSQDQSRAGLASLAGQFGISLGGMVGQAESPELYADLLRTREVLAPIATDSFSLAVGGGHRTALADFLDVRGSTASIVLDNTLHDLRTKVVSSSVVARTGMITVGVHTKSPAISLEIAERLLRGLDRFNQQTRQSQAAAERRFTEGRLAAARASLRVAEDALQRFLQANRQYQNAPELVFQQQRLQREVDLQQQIVSSLAQQYEETRIREVRDTPVITVIERPTLAAKPDPRGRALILALGVAVAFAVAVLVALLRDAVRRRREDTDPGLSMLMQEWERMRGRSHPVA